MTRSIAARIPAFTGLAARSATRSVRTATVTPAGSRVRTASCTAGTETGSSHHSWGSTGRVDGQPPSPTASTVGRSTTTARSGMRAVGTDSTTPTTVERQLAPRDGDGERAAHLGPGGLGHRPGHDRGHRVEVGGRAGPQQVGPRASAPRARRARSPAVPSASTRLDLDAEVGWGAAGRRSPGGARGHAEQGQGVLHAGRSPLGSSTVRSARPRAELAERQGVHQPARVAQQHRRRQREVRAPP